MMVGEKKKKYIASNHESACKASHAHAMQATRPFGLSNYPPFSLRAGAYNTFWNIRSSAKPALALPPAGYAPHMTFAGEQGRAEQVAEQPCNMDHATRRPPMPTADRTRQRALPLVRPCHPPVSPAGMFSGGSELAAVPPAAVGWAVSPVPARELAPANLHTAMAAALGPPEAQPSTGIRGGPYWCTAQGQACCQGAGVTAACPGCIGTVTRSSSLWGCRGERAAASQAR
jgi:hypothetical protein